MRVQRKLSAYIFFKNGWFLKYYFKRLITITKPRDDLVIVYLTDTKLKNNHFPNILVRCQNAALYTEMNGVWIDLGSNTATKIY